MTLNETYSKWLSLQSLVTTWRLHPIPHFSKRSADKLCDSCRAVQNSPQQCDHTLWRPLRVCLSWRDSNSDDRPYNWYNEEEQKGELTPVELAAIFHYRYIRIHPFEDGNGRIARLMRDNPDITYAQLTTDLGINTSAVQKLVKRMTNNGYITRLENGSWRVIATSIV